MFVIISLILIILPLLFQIIFGRKAIGETISFSFTEVCFISFVLQIIFAILSFKIASYDFTDNHGQSRCGMWIMGLLGLVFISIILLIVIIIIQYFIKRSYEKTQK